MEDNEVRLLFTSSLYSLFVCFRFVSHIFIWNQLAIIGEKSFEINAMDVYPNRNTDYQYLNILLITKGLCEVYVECNLERLKSA